MLEAAIFLILAAAATVAWIKGKRQSTIILGLTVIGWYGWIVTASRLAKPGSWWYLNHYDADKRALADVRYPGEAQQHTPTVTPPLTVDDLTRERDQLEDRLAEVEARLVVEEWTP